MKFKSQKGSVALFVLIALLFYMGFLLLLYANNLNKIQSISEKIEFIKSIYEKNVNNIDDVYNRRFAQNDNMQPIIKDIPTQIITNKIEGITNNVTKLEDSYEEYGKLGGKTDYMAFNNIFLSLKEVIQHVELNNLYGNCDLQINAYGNNGKKTTKQQTIQILKGVEVENESDLNKALSIGEPLYIKIKNNIECVNTIRIDNVNHKIDLNNNVISCQKVNETYKFITLGEKTELTILDSSTEKNGTIIANMKEESVSDGKNRTRQVSCINNYGMLTIESGKIAVNIVQKMLQKNDGTSLDDTGIAIENAGTVFLKGGNIHVNVETLACTYLVIKTATSTGIGIHSWGTLNLENGNINSNAVASMERGTLATQKGRTYAYAYGIKNEGTLNNSNNIIFKVSAIANQENTTTNEKEELDIKQ